MGIGLSLQGKLAAAIGRPVQVGRCHRSKLFAGDFIYEFGEKAIIAGFVSLTSLLSHAAANAPGGFCHLAEGFA